MQSILASDFDQGSRGTLPLLSAIFNPFIEASPLSVRMWGLTERLLSPEQLDQWFEPFAQEQYTRELLFSTQAMQAAIPMSIQAVDGKLRGWSRGDGGTSGLFQ